MHDYDLKNNRTQLQKLGKALITDSNNTFLRGKLFSLKKFYKKLLTKKKNAFKQEIISRLEALEKTNPKEYWSLFDKLKRCDENAPSDSTVCIEEWLSHYSKLLGKHNIEKSKHEQIIKQLDKLVISC